MLLNIVSLNFNSANHDSVPSLEAIFLCLNRDSLHLVRRFNAGFGLEQCLQHLYLARSRGVMQRCASFLQRSERVDCVTGRVRNSGGLCGLGFQGCA